MKSEKWDLKTSIGDWDVPVKILCMIVLLLIGCSHHVVKKDSVQSAVYDLGYIHSVCTIDSCIIIITNMQTVVLSGIVQKVPIGAQVLMQRYSNGDYITWHGLAITYKVKQYKWIFKK